MKFSPLLFTLAFLIIACNKKEKKQAISYLDPMFKAKIWFHPGSYWVYRDSLNGKEDSFVVRASGTDINESMASGSRTEVLSVSTKCYISDGSISDSSSLSFWGSNVKNFEPSFSHKMPDGYMLYLHFNLNYPFNEQSIGTYSLKDTGYMVSSMIKYEVSDLTFTNVSEVAIKSGNTSSNQVYFNDSVGIIKIRINYGNTTKYQRVLELIRWNLIK